jgi:hypothetical protein
LTGAGKKKGKEGHRPDGQAGLLGRLGGNGPDVQWGGEEKKLTFEFQNCFLGLGKLITENQVAEIIGKNSQKIVGKLGMQECELE